VHWEVVVIILCYLVCWKKEREGERGREGGSACVRMYVCVRTCWRIVVINYALNLVQLLGST
jgi:hypothetical protein